MNDKTSMPRRLLDDPDALARLGPDLQSALRDEGMPIDVSAAATRLNAAVADGARPRFDPWRVFSNALASPLVAFGAGVVGVALGATLHAMLAQPIERIVEVEKPVDRVVERVVEKLVEVPVERVVGRAVEKVEKVEKVERVEKVVEVPAERVVAPVPTMTSEPKPTLADELSYIGRATAALENRRADVALQEIDAYRRAYPKQRFAFEADAIQARAAQLADP